VDHSKMWTLDPPERAESDYMRTNALKMYVHQTLTS